MKKALYILITLMCITFGIAEVECKEAKLTYKTGKCVIDDSVEKIPGVCQYKCTAPFDSAIDEYNAYKYEDIKKNGLTMYLKVSENKKDISKVSYEFTGADKLIFIEAYSLLSYEDEISSNINELEDWIINRNFECHTDIDFIPMQNFEHVAAGVYGGKFYWDLTIKDIFVDDEKPVVNNECGMLGSKDGELVKILKQIYMYIKIIIPVLIIGLGIADLLKSLGTGKDDDLKKAINKFAKRIILTIVFILVPIIISILINISGITSQYDKINDGIKSLFCIIE